MCVRVCIHTKSLCLTLIPKGSYRLIIKNIVYQCTPVFKISYSRSKYMIGDENENDLSRSRANGFPACMCMYMCVCV